MSGFSLSLVSHPDIYSLQAVQEDRDSIIWIAMGGDVELSIITILISQPMVMDNLT